MPRVLEKASGSSQPQLPVELGAVKCCQGMVKVIEETLRQQPAPQMTHALHVELAEVHGAIVTTVIVLVDT